MIPDDDDVILVVNVLVVQIEGVWYTLEVAVLPDGRVHSIIQIGLGVRE